MFIVNQTVLLAPEPMPTHVNLIVVVDKTPLRSMEMSGKRGGCWVDGLYSVNHEYYLDFGANGRDGFAFVATGGPWILGISCNGGNIHSICALDGYGCSSKWGGSVSSLLSLQEF